MQRGHAFWMVFGDTIFIFQISSNHIEYKQYNDQAHGFGIASNETYFWINFNCHCLGLSFGSKSFPRL
jgi:hypothetical protein